MHVLMIDDHVMFLQGMQTLLAQLAPGQRIDGTDRMEAALRLVASNRYDLVLLDWNLTDGNGGDAIPVLRENGCTAPIVILSGESGDALIRDAIEQGAAGFIPKTYSSEKMIAALNHVLAGCVFLPGETPLQSPTPITISAGQDARLSCLTQRQLDVYRAATRGLPNKMISRELGIGSSTVKSHLAAVYAALGVSNRTEAAFLASREGTQLFGEHL